MKYLFYIMLSFLLITVPSKLIAQVPTSIDLDTGRRDINFWENPWYIVGLVFIIAAAVLIIRWRRKS